MIPKSCSSANSDTSPLLRRANRRLVDATAAVCVTYALAVAVVAAERGGLWVGRGFMFLWPALISSALCLGDGLGSLTISLLHSLIKIFRIYELYHFYIFHGHYNKKKFALIVVLRIVLRVGRIGV